MNRFTRNNLLLLIVIACSCLAAAGLLVFSIIKYVDMNKCIAEVQKRKDEVKKLSSENPSPTEANKEPLKTNAALYNAEADKMARYFSHPMQKHATDFILKLKETNPPKEDGKVIPLTVERFKRDFEEMWSKGQSYVNKRFDYQGFREQRFTNWDQVVREMLPIVRKTTNEPVNEDNLPEVLFAYIGIPRLFDEQPENMVKFIRDYQNVLVNLMTRVKFDLSTISCGFGSDVTEVGIRNVFNSPRDHYPNVVRVWNIYGDVIKRLVECNPKLVYVKDGKQVVEPKESEIVARLAATKTPYTEIDDKVDLFGGLWLRAAMDPQKNTNPETLRNAVSGDEEGPFKVYRMRISITATMAGIRTFVRSLEEAYKLNQVYVVRSVALYAEQDGAFEIFQRYAERAGIKTNLTGVQKETVDKNTSTATTQRSRGRGRGRGRAVVQENENAGQENSKAELQQLEEQKRRQEEEKPFQDRDGYGNVLIGDYKNYRAVIDFDVFQLK